MIWADDCYNYKDNKGYFISLCSIDYSDDDKERESIQVDYNKENGRYRVTHFLNNHWNGDVIFDQITNAYCPLCNEERYIPEKIGYCCKCGHHLNRLEGKKS